MSRPESKFTAAEPVAGMDAADQAAIDATAFHPAAGKNRIRTMVEAARPLFDDVDWDAREEEWVGSRPCTPDGLPLIGATRHPKVFVAGGHGMWGITLGPITGRLLAEQGTLDELLAATVGPKPTARWCKADERAGNQPGGAGRRRARPCS